MPCKDRQEAISAYADGQASAAQAALLKSHLAACDACRTHLRWIVGLKKAAGRIALSSAPENLSADILRGLNIPLAPPSPARGEGGHWLGRFFAPRLAWATAAACAGLALVFLVKRHYACERLSVDWMLAEHNQYELTIPAPSKELAFSNLADHLAAGLDHGEPHAL